MVYIYHNFETRPGPAGRPGARTRPGWRKNRGRKNPVWTRLTRQVDPATRLQTRWLLFFLFCLLKRCRFDFFKKKNRPGRPGDPVKTRNPGRPPDQVLKLWYIYIHIYVYIYIYIYIYIIHFLLKKLFDPRRCASPIASFS